MSEHFHTSMDRKIFNLELSVEATSAYIVVTSILSENARPDLESIRNRWIKSDEELDQALGELVGRQVLQVQSSPQGETLYYPKPSSLWR